MIWALVSFSVSGREGAAVAGSGLTSQSKGHFRGLSPFRYFSVWIKGRSCRGGAEEPSRFLGGDLELVTEFGSLFFCFFL